MQVIVLLLLRAPWGKRRLLLVAVIVNDPQLMNVRSLPRERWRGMGAVVELSQVAHDLSSQVDGAIVVAAGSCPGDCQILGRILSFRGLPRFVPLFVVRC